MAFEKRRVCSDEKRAALKASRKATALRRKSQVARVYELKVVEKRLNNKQREELAKLFVEGKWFYNHVLGIHKNNNVYLNTINSTEIQEVQHIDKDKNVITTPLKVLGSQMKQAIVTRMISSEKAIKTLIDRGFQTHGSLGFKSEMTCIPLKQHGITYNFKSFNKVKIAGISGTLLVRGRDQIQEGAEFANANLLKRADGYFLKITCYFDKSKFKQANTVRNGRELGLDLGIKTAITTSDGEKINAQVGESERLKQLQRELAHREEGSSNYRKTQKKLDREYQRLANKKEDIANKVVHEFKSYACIVMQDEQLNNWKRRRRRKKGKKGTRRGFGRKVQSGILGRVKAKTRALPQTIMLDKWIPTTKWCPECGTLNNHMTLADRVFTCGCGLSEDRDVHAAKNMLIIKDLVFSHLSKTDKKFVPTEHREITLMEFKASVGDSNVAGKPGRGSEKITPFKV